MYENITLQVRRKWVTRCDITTASYCLPWGGEVGLSRMHPGLYLVVVNASGMIHQCSSEIDNSGEFTNVIMRC